MEPIIGVDEGRTALGKLASEVAEGSGPVVITRRGRALAVLLSPEQYEELRRGATDAARAEMRAKLAEVRAAGAPPGFSSGG